MTLLFQDPVHDGPTDPVLLANPRERSWWLLYTSRRSDAPDGQGVAWVHGTDIGIAASRDGGATWTYRGTVPGLAHEPGHNTFWAPEVLWAGETCHMFVTYIQGIPTAWEGHERHIHHYTSADLVHWQHHGPLPLSSDRVIDACVYALPGGGYRLWYKDEADGLSTWAVDSTDLFAWHSPRRVLATEGGHEGPNVFMLGTVYWLLVDCWSGQLVYRSDDLDEWHPAGRILGPETGRPGTLDVGPGLHADVHVNGDSAYVVYFTHREGSGRETRQSSIHAAGLTTDGHTLRCDRSDAVRLALAQPGMVDPAQRETAVVSGARRPPS
jgi:hypothetical protein